MNSLSWKNLIKEIEPYPWTIINKHSDAFLEKNHNLLVDYTRYRKIVQKYLKYKKLNDFQNILDVGVYPGCLPQILSKIESIEKYNYFGLGLGFSQEFKNEMKKIKVNLLDVDLDPRLNLNKNIPNTIPLNSNFCDLIILTDVIEHFFDPFYPLKEMNRVSKLGGKLILTTDNLPRFDLVFSIFKGNSIYTKLIESNIFFNGDWRPHFREYSKSELVQLLNWAGFDIVEHEFFNNEFGLHRLENNKIVKRRISSSFKSNIRSSIESVLTSILPRLKNHHIIVAEKIDTYESIIKNSPYITTKTDEWLKLRSRFS